MAKKKGIERAGIIPGVEPKKESSKSRVKATGEKPESLKLYTFRAQPELIERIKQTSKDTGIPASELMRRAVNYYFDKVLGDQKRQEMIKKKLAEIERLENMLKGDLPNE